MRVLLLEGDDSTARFLTHVLGRVGVTAEHQRADIRLTAGGFDAVILGDLPYRDLGERAADDLADQVRQGMGFFITGGPHAYGRGDYAETPIAGLLPVRIMHGDDRVEAPNARPRPVALHPLTEGLSFVDAPRLAAFHKLVGKGSGQTVLDVENSREGAAGSHYPLLVIGRRERGRVVVFGADLGPKGGLTEWGGSPLVPLDDHARVGVHYLTLVARLTWWVGRGEREPPRIMERARVGEEVEPAPG